MRKEKGFTLRNCARAFARKAKPSGFVPHQAAYTVLKMLSSQEWRSNVSAKRFSASNVERRPIRKSEHTNNKYNVFHKKMMNKLLVFFF